MAQKILVVDDEDLILAAVERALAKVGYYVYCARDMAEIGEVIGNAPFDLLITDVHVREGGTLGEIVKAVKAVSPAVRVLRMSGVAGGEEAYDFIEKPFSIAALREKVRDILHGPS